MCTHLLSAEVTSCFHLTGACWSLGFLFVGTWSVFLSPEKKLKHKNVIQCTRDQWTVLSCLTQIVCKRQKCFDTSCSFQKPESSMATIHPHFSRLNQMFLCALPLLTLTNSQEPSHSHGAGNSCLAAESLRELVACLFPPLPCFHWNIV